jgi:hypothetical protein
MKYKGIIIEGNKKFIKQTREALKLIENRSKKDFTRVRRYLNKIRQSEDSWMDLEEAQFNVGSPTAFYSVEWYAGAIVHDTYHYYLHTVKKFLWIPKNFRKHEQICLNEQIRFLKIIDAPKYWTDHCRDALNSKYWKRKHVGW